MNFTFTWKQFFYRTDNNHNKKTQICTKTKTKNAMPKSVKWTFEKLNWIFLINVARANGLTGQ